MNIALSEELDGVAPPAWAADQLAQVVRDAGGNAEIVRERESSGTVGEVIRVRAGLPGGPLGEVVRAAGLEHPSGAEGCLLFIPAGGGEMVIVGSDARGVAHGLSEVADRVRYGRDPLAGSTAQLAEHHRAAMPVRGILRTFVSEVQDKSWFYSKSFWSSYLDELASQRINRFQLAFGMQHNYSHDVGLRDYYLCFAYPYLVKVPGWSVTAEGLPEEEQARNLESLRFASDEAARRGIQFQLGLWNHAYDPGQSPDLRYPIRGLGPDQHAEYCRDALVELLGACPSISGLTLRVHYEGGIPELGQEAFWGKVLSALGEVGRPVQLDMHAKGVSEDLIEIGVAAGSTLLLSAKYWAEHQGLPYHQAAIRDLEKARPAQGTGLDAKTHYTRRFTRYGYGDFLREDRSYGLIFRIWPGTQRLLLWGDPVLASGYGRLGTFAGALGIELCEPLTFKGRMDSGEQGGRDPYAEEQLKLGIDDWKKYLYTYRLWGRLLYEPDADPSQWRRYLEQEYGAAAANVEEALAVASRVLPLVTTVHGIGASNNGYWPEMYLNMPMAGGASSEHYARDSEEPATLGSISSFDPVLFSSIDDYVEELLSGRLSGRYSPAEVASWLERLADKAEAHLEGAKRSTESPDAPSFRRMAIDVSAQAGLGRFFARKGRAGIAYGLYQRTKDVDFLSEALGHYEAAREALATVVAATAGVYQPDLAFGKRPSEHGHWSDRLVGVDEDLAALRAEHEEAAAHGSRMGGKHPAPPVSRRVSLRHLPPTAFRPGEPVTIEADVPAGFPGSVVCKYRHVNQGESYETMELSPSGGRLVATIDGSYTRAPYALQYLFVLRQGGDAWLQPGLDVAGEVRLANQPYYLIRQEGGVGSAPGAC